MSIAGPHCPCHADLTVALANPIKFFNAHDKKSVKLEEALGGLPEVCVAGSIGRAPRNFAVCGKMREGAESQAQGERAIGAIFLTRFPYAEALPS